MMEENKEKKRLQSVSHAVQQIKEKEEEQRKLGIHPEKLENTEDSSEENLSKTEIAEQKENQELQEDFEKELEEEKIEDESLYESSDSTYESLFLSKSMLTKAEISRSSAPLRRNIADERLNTSTIEELQSLKKVLNKKSEASPTAKIEMEALKEAEDIVQPLPTVKDIPTKEQKKVKEDIVQPLPTVKDIPTKEQKRVKEEEKKELKKTSQNFKEEKIKKNPAMVSSKEIPSSEKFVAIKKEKDVLSPAEKSDKEEKNGKKEEEKKFVSYWIAYRTPLFFAIVLLFFFFIVSVLPGKQDTSSQLPIVKTNSVVPENFEPILWVEGKIISPKMEIYSQATGTVAEILCKPGDIVKKGDTLIKLSNPLLQEELQKARQSLSQALLEWQEAILLWDSFRKKQKDSEVVSKKIEDIQKQLHTSVHQWISSQEKEFQKLQANLSQQKILWENSVIENYKNLNPNQERLLLLELRCQTAYQQILSSLIQYRQKERETKELAITSPENGQIQSFFVNQGYPVFWGTKVGNLFLAGSKWIESQCSDVYFKHLSKCSKQELKAEIEFPFSDIPSLKQEKVFISVISSNAQKFFTIQVKFSSDKRDIPDNSLVSLKIVLPAKQNCIQVLKQSIVLQDRIEKSFPSVFVLKVEKERSSVREIPVVPGMTNENYVEVLDGLSGDETIVSFSSLNIKNLYDGMDVHVYK